MKVFIFICLLLITGLGGQNFPGAPNQYPVQPPNGAVVPGPPLDEHDTSIGMEPSAFPDQFTGAPNGCVLIRGIAVC
ncbi:hypothetical protein CCACVL1_13173, partial [Corchorus capsularis]